MSRRRILAAVIVVVLGSVSLYAAEIIDARDPLAVLPYRGYLQQDGLPFDGTVPMRFALWDAEPSPSPAALPLWSDVEKTVKVSAGQFSVTLGSKDNPVPQSVLTGGRPIEIAITVDGKTLDGRQRIYPVAHAIGAANANHSIGNFKVRGDLDVAGNLSVGGTAASASLDIAGVGRFGFDDRNNTSRSLIFSQDSGDEANAGSITYKPSYSGIPTLGIVGAGTTGTNRSVTVWDNLRVTGQLDIGLQRVECRDNESGWTSHKEIASPNPSDGNPMWGCECPAGTIALSGTFDCRWRGWIAHTFTEGRTAYAQCYDGNIKKPVRSYTLCARVKL